MIQVILQRDPPKDSPRGAAIRIFLDNHSFSSFAGQAIRIFRRPAIRIVLDTQSFSSATGQETGTHSSNSLYDKVRTPHACSMFEDKRLPDKVGKAALGADGSLQVMQPCESSLVVAPGMSRAMQGHSKGDPRALQGRSKESPRPIKGRSKGDHQAGRLSDELTVFQGFEARVSK